MSEEKKFHSNIKFALKKAQSNYIKRIELSKKVKFNETINQIQQKIKQFQNIHNLKVELPEENKIDYPIIVETIRRLKNKIPLSNLFLQLAEFEHDVFNGYIYTDMDNVDIDIDKHELNGLRRIYSKEFKYLKRAENVRNCCNYWHSNYFRLHGVKQITSVNRCKDRFCLNCQHILSMLRFQRAKPIIDKYIEDGCYAGHVVLTQPNAKDYNLNGVLNHSLKAFGQLIEYLKCKDKIRGIDFSQYGYKGAIRSLESTMGKKNDYHLHIHGILIFDKPIDTRGENENSFSKSKSHGYRLFTDFEILIQKIWYLLMNNIKVTKKAIDGLTEGYSCILDPLDDSNIHETFKYATKLDLSADEITAERLLPLDKALTGRRIIQSYGCLRGAIKNDESINEEDIEANQKYYEAIATMLLIEEPVKVIERLKEVVENTFSSNDKVIYLTKNTFKNKGDKNE